MSEVVDVQPEVVEENAKAELSTQDLVMVVRLVDLAAARGALQGDDLEAVGGLRRRFVEFLQQNAPEVFQQPEQAKTEETTEA